MASSVLCGQSALVGLPTISNKKEREVSLMDVTIPSQLKVADRKQLKDVDSSGISVFKVSKYGKLQPRRLAFSSDNRCMYITTNRVKGIRGLFKAATSNGIDPVSTKVIDISRIDRITKGKLSKRLLFATRECQQNQLRPNNYDSSADLEELLFDDSKCLTIVYRECKAEQSSLLSASASSFVDGFGGNATGAEGASIGDDKKSAIQQGFEFLDICVADPKDMDELVATLEALIKTYREERRWMERNTLLLHYHWIDMGKASVNDSLSCNEWLELCGRLNVPLRKQELSTLFRNMKSELRRAYKDVSGGNNDPLVMDLDSGLPPWAVGELFHDLEFHSATISGIKLVKHDPVLRLWHQLLESDPTPGNSESKKNQLEHKIKPSPRSDSLSPVAFLSFIRSQQKDYKASLDDATALIKALKAQKSLKSLAGDTSNRNSKSRKNEETQNGDLKRNPTNTDPLDDGRLSKTQFLNFLFSDANDLMDPRKGRTGSDDMNHPLSHYWIMSSHDTYLNCWNRLNPVLDEQMYLAALYRGVRCLELDVWDGHAGSGYAGEPVIAREQPNSEEDPFFSLEIALKAIRQFLQTHPKTYPVILNIENHCSYPVQEKMAECLFHILGSIGLIVVPDDSQSIDESDLLPSPASMRGKVLLMGKRPKVINEGAKVVNDDYDDENDVFVDDSLPNVRSREEEHELEIGTVIGFDAKGPIRALDKQEQKNIVKHTPGELLYIAKQELENAELEAAQAELKAHEAEVEAKKADKHADTLIRNAGLSEEAVAELLGQIKGVEIDPDEHVDLLPRREGEGVEVQDFFADAVESAKLTFAEADQIALKAAEKATIALQKLNQATLKLREAEELLEASFVKGKKVGDKFQKAAKVARDKQEIADHAKRRVEKLRQLLKELEEGANSAQNVVNTAMTEAKISEKRASETEARAARAAATAQKDRTKAEEETRKEEELERQAAALHEQMIDAANKEKDAKERAEKAGILLEKLNEQIKLIENSSQYLKEKQEMSEGIIEEKKESNRSMKGKLHSKLAAKIEERRFCTDSLRQATTEISISSKRRKQAQEAFELKAHQWKSQAETASKFRKISDKSSHTAEDLAEHAEEEREAANLRRVAMDRAKSHVSEKDSYRAGLTAQLAEAERAFSEANVEAVKTRQEADRLANVSYSVGKGSHDDIAAITDKRRAIRDDLLADYKRKKKMKEEAEAKAAETKKLYETSDQVFSDAMRIAQTDQEKLDLQRRQDKNALVAVNSARLAHKQAEHLLEQARYAQAIVTEKQCILKRAEEYKEKTDRIIEIPPNLAKMTFLHTTKYRYWEKSLQLPSTHVHSFAEGVLDQMAKMDGQDHTKNLKRFTFSHLCRSFPSWKDFGSSSKLNSDPLFQWSLGCQFVSLNYGTFDEQLVKADGRFRRNGSCGYALKPESIRSFEAFQEKPESWKIQVLCGSCFPKPDFKFGTTGTQCISPFVKINVYGGDLEQRKGEHKTKVVQKNGFNPVFDDEDGFSFKATSPSLAILTFTVCHLSNDGSEQFLGGAAMPVGCIREGFRSVPLFDKQNSRTGAHGYAYLLVKSQKLT
ncbi:phosphatidylinositol-specific phospholipase C, X domain containing protein [Nitzschia inconspicua]|uniref:phosphoinositide phospholipase C n=1 Tax=Nitzschia inconspicua TaxID=303405 RepID=A0A9K3Q1D4_9STRA|nr:phosphatidylinositol-specific phospholipase C, X domain containing protein [Nitzschia inconspicua]